MATWGPFFPEKKPLDQLHDAFFFSFPSMQCNDLPKKETLGPKIQYFFHNKKIFKILQLHL
jgi:hypothetical protein